MPSLSFPLKAATSVIYWTETIENLAAGTAAPDTFTFKGYSSYIAPRGIDPSLMTMAAACHEDTSQRLIFTVFPPEDQTSTYQPYEVFNAENPITSAGSVTSALQTENGGEHQSCLVGNAYFAGSDAEGVGQIGMIGFDNLPPKGLWTLKKSGEEFATFDLELSNPVADEGHIKMFVPKVVMETTSGNVSKLTIKFHTRDAASKEYVEMADLGAFKRIATEFGLSVSRYNEQGGSSDVGGARPSAVEGNAFVVSEFKDQGDNIVEGR